MRRMTTAVAANSIERMSWTVAKITMSNMKMRVIILLIGTIIRNTSSTYTIGLYIDDGIIDHGLVIDSLTALPFRDKD